MPTYTRGDVKNRLNAGIKGKVGILVDGNETINTAVRTVMSEIDLRSSKRVATLVPGLFSGAWEYPVQSDLKGIKVISLQTLENEFRQTPYELVTPIEFAQYRKVGTVAIDEQDLVRKLLVSGGSDRQVSIVVSSFDALDSGGGVWGPFGDGENVVVDDGEFIRGRASLKFDINAAAGTTAGIVNSTMHEFDFSAFQGTNDSIFVWVKIVDPEGITNFSVRYGDDSVNYNQVSIVKTHFNTVFTSGWNLLRFDVSNRTVVGVPTTVGNYVSLFMTKDVTKVSELGYKVDNLVFKSGKAQTMRYYSKYAWIDATTGAWKENATTDSDFLIADTDEYNLFLDKLIELAGDEVDEAQASVNAQARYMNRKSQYERENPSEAMLLTYDYQAQYYI